jgi:hypothetical protein
LDLSPLNLGTKVGFNNGFVFYDLVRGSLSQLFAVIQNKNTGTHIGDEFNIMLNQKKGFALFTVEVADTIFNRLN